MRQWLTFVVACLVTFPVVAQPVAPRDTDLDRFMAAVLTTRDDNWKKLQQYILHERQRIDVTGPHGLKVFGSSNDYQWFVKEGFFIRSPLAKNGVGIGEAERRRYEERYLSRMKTRDEKKATRDAERGRAPAPPPEAIGDLLSQQAEPSFVSAAYFLEFKFEPGRYALAGRDTIDGREILRIEYHPQRLFSDDTETEIAIGSQGASVSRTDRDAERRRRRRQDQRERDVEERVERQMNKTSLVTLWVLRNERQIVRYVFDNVDWGFLPGRSLARMDELSASMRMQEAFPGIWLPLSIEGRARVGTALGPTGVNVDVTYSDYRQASVGVRVK